MYNSPVSLSHYSFFIINLENIKSSPVKHEKLIKWCLAIYYHTLLKNLFQVTTCEIAQLESTQEETDTRIVLYLLYAAHLGHKVVVVRTPDRHFLHPPAPRTIHPADLLRRHWDRKSQADLLR